MRASSNILLLLLSSVCSAAEAAALTNLPQLHEALLTGPIGRRYTSASLLPAAAVDASKQTWALGFAQTDVRGGGTASAQVTLVSADFNGGTSQVVASSLPVDGAAAASIVRDPATGLEFRMVRTASGGGGEPVTVVEIWDGEVRLARAVDASIGKGLPAGVFGRPSFSPSGGSVTWAAAAQPTEPSASESSYWPNTATTAKPDDGSPPDGSGPIEGKYAYRRGLGEVIDAAGDVSGSVVVVWDWRAGLPPYILTAEAILPKDESKEADDETDDETDGALAVLAHPCYDGGEGGILFQAYLLPPWRPGLSACLNRPTRIYHYPLTRRGDGGVGGASDGASGTSAATCLTPDLWCALVPRMSPDGGTLAFVAHAQRFAGHATHLELRAMKWPPRAGATPAFSSSVLLAPDETAVDTEGAAFSGICGFHDELNTLAWLDGGSTLCFSSLVRGEKATYTCTLAEADVPESTAADGALTSAGALRCARLERLLPPNFAGGGLELLSAAQGTMVMQHSSLRAPPAVWAFRPAMGEVVDAAAEKAAAEKAAADGSWVRLTDTASLVPLLEDELTSSALEAMQGARLVRVARPEREGGAEALLLLPNRPQAEAALLPWVLRPHGGPHSTALDAWSVETALLVASGVAVLFPQFRGTLGYGKEFCDSLHGNVGTMDVEDCIELTRLALSELPTDLDPARGAVYGGSHGGYLTAWLLGDPLHNGLYRGGVLWNPVTDLLSMVGTTDIPEWCWAEGLAESGGPQWPLSSEKVERLRAASPISNVHHVSAPALLLLGDADQRVPPSQGRQWAAALQQQPHPRAPLTVLQYPGGGHSIAGTEQNAHAQQTACSWLIEQLK